MASFFFGGGGRQELVQIVGVTIKLRSTPVLVGENKLIFRMLIINFDSIIMVKGLT